MKTNLKGKLSVSLVSEKETLKSKMTPEGMVVTIPQAMRAALAQREAVVIRLSKARG